MCISTCLEALSPSQLGCTGWVLATSLCKTMTQTPQKDSLPDSILALLSFLYRRSVIADKAESALEESYFRLTTLTLTSQIGILESEECLVSRPERMVSHNWGNLFVHLLAAIIADAMDTDYFGRIADQLVSGKVHDLVAHLRYMQKLSIRYWVCA